MSSISMSKANKATKLYQRAMETTTDGSGEFCRSHNLRRSIFEDALQLYNKALSANHDDFGGDPSAERLSICKNIGMTCLRLAQVLMESQAKVKDTMRIFYYVNECVENLSLNWYWREGERELEWGDKVSGYMNAAFDVAFQSLGDPTDENWLKQLHQLDKILKEIGPDPSLHRFRLRFYTDRAQFYNRCAVKIMEMNNFKLAAQVIEYCRCDCDFAKKYAPLVDDDTSAALVFHLKDVQDVMKFLKASCESVKLRTTADDLLENALKKDSGELQFELMWDILDMYKGAAIAAANEDIKNETIAIAKQGIVFHKVFNLESYAKTYCQRALEVANFIMRVQTQEWFHECLEVIKECRRRKEALDELEREKIAAERAPYLEQLVKELEDLKAVEHDSFKLLKHIYATQPPKQDPDFKYDEKEVNSGNVKKVLMKAIFHYHPDKQTTFEKKWQVLCEEITKCLTGRYECMKGI